MLFRSVAAMRIIKTAKGDKMAFVTLEDVTGSIECVFFPKALPRAQAVLESKRPVLLRGVVEHKGEEVKMLADSAELLEDLRERSTALVEVFVKVPELTEEGLASLPDLLDKNRGAAYLKIWLEEPGVYRTRVAAGEGWRVAATPKLVDGLRALGTVRLS